MRKTFSRLVCLTIGIFVLVSVIPTKQTSLTEEEQLGSTGWLDGWLNRKAHNITGSTSGPQIDYQVQIIVHYGNGSDEGEDVFLNGRCEPDFGDVRFTDSTGVIELDYWIEKKVDWLSAVMWVEANYIPSFPDNATIYLYYGNDEVSTASDGDETFLFWDDFETDLSKWNLSGSPPPQLSTDYPFEGVSGLKLQKNINSAGTALNVTTNTAIRIWFYDQMSGNLEKQWVASVTGAIGVDEEVDPAKYIYKIGVYYTSSIIRTVGWHLFEIANNGSKTIFRIDNQQQTMTDPGNITVFSIASYWSDNNEVGYYDVAIQRKYAEPEPTHSGWGNEEETPLDQTPPEIISVRWTPTSPQPYVPSITPRHMEPVEVVTNITDEVNGSGVNIVTLSYRVEYEWWNTTMTLNATNGLWTAMIPGQPGNSTVELRIEAYDQAGNRAESPILNYEVQHLLVGDLNGDGDVDIYDIVMAASNYGKKYP